MDWLEEYKRKRKGYIANSRNFFCVVRIANDLVVYEGQSEQKAAEALEAGTHFGIGKTKSEAKAAAVQAVEKLRKGS